MRRSIIFFSVVACVFFLATANAFMQSGSGKQQVRSQVSQQKIVQLSKEAPADLKLLRMSEAAMRGAAPGKALYVAQFFGPTQDPSTNPSTLPITIQAPLTVDSISNGGFESAVSPWAFSGVAMRSTGGSAQSGTGYLLMGGANSSSGSASQEINLRRGSSPRLTFWLNVTSSETAMAPNDRLFVEVCDRSGRTVKTLAVFSNLNQLGPGEYTMRGGYSLAQFTGRPLMIRFRTTTDEGPVTTFRIDAVSVK
jgi:hypothetical protein